MKRIVSIIMSILILSLCLCSCESSDPSKVVPVEEDGWFAAWGNAPQRGGDDQIPTKVKIKDNTLRQLITPTLGGDKLKLTLSNQYGSIPLIIESIHIAKADALGSSAIDTSTDTVVTFDGKDNIVIDIEEVITSDEIDFSFSALEPLAVTIKFGKFVGGDYTCHGTANTTCWIAEGDHVSDETMPAGQTMSCWYYIVGMETWAKAGTSVAVCLGDSITDGVGASLNTNTSWPDQFDALLKANPDTANTAVINMGISGNILGGDWGVKSRLERDVLNVAGVKYCFVLIGINDIGGAQENISERLIGDYKEIVKRCHEKGIKVYACTMTPVKGSGYYSELHEEIRTELNEFLVSGKGGFDGFIDFSASIARDDDPSQMKDEYNCPWGDFLHPGDLGYTEMAKLAYEKFLEFTK